MKLADLIAAKETELRDARNSYDAALARQKGILTTVRDEARKELSKLETADFEALEADKARADKRAADAQRKLDELREVAVDETKTEARQADVTPVPGQRAAEGRSYDDVARVVSEPRVYTRDTARQNVSFFQDAYRATFHQDPNARARQERHASEVVVEGEVGRQVRATSTSSYAGLVVPQYLVDEAALALRNGRPLANIIRRQQIPEQGDTFQVPRGTTGASVDVQTAQNAAVSNTDEAWSNVTVPVVTISGQQQVSRQSLDRGTPGIDGLIYTDLVNAYAARVDYQVINGTGSSGQVFGFLNTSGKTQATAFGGAITAALFTSKIAGAIQSVASAGTAIQPRIVVMHPRRWGWLQSLTDSTGRPLSLAMPLGPNNAAALVTAPGAYSGDGDPASTGVPQLVGQLANGLPVLTDANIPTAVGSATGGEDIALVLDTHAHILWEDGDGMPRQFRFDQTYASNLQTLLVVAGYVAFTAGRYPAATAVVGGLDTSTNGMVSPSF